MVIDSLNYSFFATREHIPSQIRKVKDRRFYLTSSILFQLSVSSPRNMRVGGCSICTTHKSLQMG